MQIYLSKPSSLTPGYTDENLLVQHVNTQLLVYAKTRQHSDFVYSQKETEGFVSYRLILHTENVGLHPQDSRSRCLLLISRQGARLQEYMASMVEQTTGLKVAISVCPNPSERADLRLCWNQIRENADLFLKNIELYN